MQKHEQKKEEELNGHYFSSSARGDERGAADGPRFVSAQTHGWNFRVVGGGGGGGRTAPRGALLPDLRYSFNRKADDWVDRELISCLFFFTPLLQRSMCWPRAGGGAGGGAGDNEQLETGACAYVCVRSVHCKQCRGGSLLE